MLPTLCRPSQALDSPGHAAPAWHREPGQRVRRAGLGGARAPRPRGAGRSASAIRSKSCCGRRPRTSSTSTSRSRRGSPRPRCATPPRSTSPPSTRRRSGCSRPRWRGRWSRSSSAASMPAPWPRRRRGSCWSATSRPPTSWSSRAGASASGSQVVDDLEALYLRLAARRHDPGRRVRRSEKRLEGGPAADRRRPPRAHRPFLGLRDAGRGPDRDRSRPWVQGDRDHRPQEVSGALAARRVAGSMDDFKVIVAEEVMTADARRSDRPVHPGEGPKGTSMAETIKEIKRHGGLVYVPHPFDRLHSVPDYENLLNMVEDIDLMEVFNPRVARHPSTRRPSVSRGSTGSFRPPDPTNTSPRASVRSG